MKTTSVLFVCLGNICRSPTAHAVFRQLVTDQGLSYEIDSAGTISAHENSAPDPRSMKHGQLRGYDFSGIYSRKVNETDFEQFDYILAMDKANYSDLRKICPEHYHSKIQLFLEYASEYPDYNEVPDPYYGGDAGFELVLDLIESASNGLMTHLNERKV